MSTLSEIRKNVLAVNKTAKALELGKSVSMAYTIVSSSKSVKRIELAIFATDLNNEFKLVVKGVSSRVCNFRLQKNKKGVQLLDSLTTVETFSTESATFCDEVRESARKYALSQNVCNFNFDKKVEKYVEVISKRVARLQQDINEELKAREELKAVTTKAC